MASKIDRVITFNVGCIPLLHKICRDLRIKECVDEGCSKKRDRVIPYGVAVEILTINRPDEWLFIK